MGTFSVTIEIGDPEGRRWEAVEALVDTGSSDTAVPGSLLRRLGIVPHDRWPFRMADEHVEELEVGQTWVRVQGRAAIRIVVFAAEGTQALLGADTLEGLSLGVDPKGRRLIRVPGLLM